MTRPVLPIDFATRRRWNWRGLLVLVLVVVNSVLWALLIWTLAEVTG
ncbi:hypothetical protein [Jannaschia formosa]|nr:hypothetical protein [Jannaschia formosa]